MDEMYPRINQLANEQVYTFMKENEISPLSYHFSDFFDECLDKYNIKLMEHHFSNQQIEGLTLIDDYGMMLPLFQISIQLYIAMIMR